MNHDLELAKHTARVMDAVTLTSQPRDPAEHCVDWDDGFVLMTGGYNSDPVLRSARPALRKGYDPLIWFDMDTEGGYPRFVEMRRGGKRIDLIPFADLTADGQIACEEEVSAYLNDGYGT